MGRRSRKRSGAPPHGAAPPERYARSRARDEAVRRSLEPLPLGQRPGAVSVAAVVALALALANLAAALAGESLGGNATGQTVVWTTVLVVCAAGMWFGARHWAVMGFMVILVFQILILFFALIRVERWWVALLVLVAIGLLGWLFFKLIRALARIQMPERPVRPR